MQPPFFAYERGDLQVYKDLKSLVKNTEKFDVEQREYIFWDANGLEFDLDTSLWPVLFRQINENLVVAPESNIGIHEVKRITEAYCNVRGIDTVGGVPGMAQAIARYLAME